MTRKEHIEWLKQTVDEKIQWVHDNDEFIAKCNEWIKKYREWGWSDDLEWAEGMRRKEYRARAKNRKRVTYWTNELNEAKKKYGMEV